MNNSNGKNGHGKISLPATIPDQLQPHNLEAEQAVLGGLLIDPDAIVYINHKLAPADFFIVRHGTIYEAIQNLHANGQPADIVTVPDELDRLGQLKEIGGSSYLAELIRLTPTSSHIEYYADIVRSMAIRRRLIDASGQISRLSFAGDLSADDAIQEASNILLGVSKTSLTNEPQRSAIFCDALLDDLERLDENGQSVTGLSTGITKLDKMTGGFQPSNLILIAGRPGMGKSSLGLQIATHAAKQWYSCLYFSLEMPGKQLIRRMVSAESGIDNELIKRGPLLPDQRRAIVEAANKVATWPVHIDDRSRSIEEIRAKAIIHHARHNTGLIVVDYLQRVQSDSGRRNNRDDELGQVSRILKGMAMELNIPIIAISSLNRQCELRHDKRPMLSDLRESGSLEYDADDVMFLYRDEVYNTNTEFPGVAEINIAKQRDGKTGPIMVFFKKQLTTFIDLETRTVSA